MTRARLVPLLVALAACGPAAPPAPRVALAITDVVVIDPRDGSATPGRTILIDGDSIVDVVAADAETDAQRVVDGAGRYAIPGLWDMHVHALWADSIPEQLLPRFVAWGVTGVRDMGGTARGLLDARRLAGDGRNVVPRVLASGPVLDGPEPVDASISFAIADSAGAVAAIDSLVRLGADFAKVYTLLPPDAFRAAARRAAEVGLPIIGHVPGDVLLADAVAYGMRSIEHLREEIEPICTRADSVACAVELDLLARGSVWQTPTLVVIDAKTRLAEPEFEAPAAMAAMPPDVRAMWQSLRDGRLDRDEAYWRMRRERWADVVWLVRRLHDAGVPILAGTDAPVLFTYPGESLHRELELLVAAGLPPLDALRAATLAPARFLGEADRTGAIGRGFTADIVLLEENPLADIRATRAIAGVVRAGRWLDRNALDALLASPAPQR